MIDKIYQARFDPATVRAKKELWGVLVEQLPQRYVPTEAATADIGGGSCEVINVKMLPGLKTLRKQTFMVGVKL